MNKKAFIIALVTALLITGLVFGWTPPGNIIGRWYYNITNFTNITGAQITATGYFHGDGSLLTGITANSTDFWDELDSPLAAWTNTFNLTYDNYVTANVSSVSNSSNYCKQSDGDFNVSEDIYIGTAEGNRYIYFYNDSSPTSVWLRYDDPAEQFQMNAPLGVQSYLVVTNNTQVGGKLYTTESDSNLWLGSHTESVSAFRANADGSLNISTGEFQVNTTGSITEVESIHLDDNEKMYFGDDKDVSIYFNGTHLITKS